MKIEIARSFSQKVNLGNYQTVDFFSSAKCECDEKEATNKSKELYKWCKEQVERDVALYKMSLEDDNVEIPEK